MFNGMVETVTITLTAHLFKTAAFDGSEEHYFATIRGIAAGSGATPEEAYKSLALCLAFGDEDVANEERVEPWQEVVQKAVTAAHGAKETDVTQLSLPES